MIHNFIEECNGIMHKFKTYRKNYDRFPTDYFLVSCPFSIETNTILWVTYKIPKCILQFKVAIEQCRFSRSNLKTNWEIAKVVSNFQGTLHLPTLEPATKNGWGNKYYIAFRYTTTEECRFFCLFFFSFKNQRYLGNMSWYQFLHHCNVLP